MEEKFLVDKERIPVFIGENGEVKKKIEEVFSCNVDINSDTGEILVENLEPSRAFVLSNVIDAINKGHTPSKALQLDDEFYVMDVIDVKQYVRNDHRLKVVMGRVIGRDGSTRKAVEEITKCDVAIGDREISIIGPYENIILVHEAFEKLIKGASHSSFYSYLERNKVEPTHDLL